MPIKKRKTSKSHGAKPIYGFRPVLNAEDIHAWGREQGFETMLMPDDMHVTVLLSKRPFDPFLSMMAEEGVAHCGEGNTVVEGGIRLVMGLGQEGNVVALRIEHPRLTDEWKHYRDQGASWDHPDYHPHITLTYKSNLDLADITPYEGVIVLGETQYRPLNDDDGKDVEEVSPVADIMKRAVSDEVFTDPMEAAAMAMSLGLGPAAHLHEIDGQAFYMPGVDHEAYIEHKRAALGDLSDPLPTPEQFEALLLQSIVGASRNDGTEKRRMAASIVKVNADERIVWGWASVITEDGEVITDTQGDQITPTEMVKAASAFMLSVRAAKAMHEGGQVGEVIHSFPLTDELGKLLGVYSKRQGWIIAMKIHDDEVWKRVKSGELKAFSIGGKGKRNAL